MTGRKLALAAGLSALLLFLNYYRDLSRTIKNYAWERVTAQTLHRVVSAPGVMEAANVTTIKSEVDESVVRKFVQEGQTVKAGQPLMELSRTRTLLEFQQKKNALADAEADYKKATREVSLQKKLFRDRAVSRAQVEDAERNLQKVTASRDIYEREFAMAQKKLDSTLVRSPINGTVLKDYTVSDANVSGGKELITVGDTSRFAVRAKVDELDIQQVRVGLNVAIKADAYPDQELIGKVSSIATQAERDTFAKIEVLVDIVDSKGLSLKHNLSVRVQIRTEDIPDALGIPIRSVLKKDGARAWVLSRSALGLVRRKTVTLGRPAGDDIEVTDGLSPGDRVGIPIPLGAPGE